MAGLLLLVIAFALGWIPYVEYVGGLLGLIGLVLVFIGRRAFGPDHHRMVVAGSAIYAITLIGAFALALVLVASVASLSTVTNINQTTDQLSLDLTVAFVGVAVLGVIGAVGRVLLVYALADRTTARLLWAALGTSIVVAFLIELILLPLVSTAVAQALASSPVNPGPVEQLQTFSALLGLANVVPSALFAVAYYRVREEAINRRQPG